MSMERRKIMKKTIGVLALATFLVIGINYFKYTDKTVSGEFETIKTSEEKPVLKTLEEWQEINPDVVMLLEFEDEEIYRSIPIVYREEEPDYYYKRSVYGKKDSMGTAFLDEICNMTSQNLIINGHSSKRNTFQFTFLKKYCDEEYFDEHPIFKMIDDEGEHTYLIVSIAEVDMNEDCYLGWYTDGFNNANEVKEMFEEIKPYAHHQREITYQGQGMITLITCNMEEENSRYVIQGIKL